MRLAVGGNRYVCFSSRDSACGWHPYLVRVLTMLARCVYFCMGLCVFPYLPSIRLLSFDTVFSACVYGWLSGYSLGLQVSYEATSAEALLVAHYSALSLNKVSATDGSQLLRLPAHSISFHSCILTTSNTGGNTSDESSAENATLVHFCTPLHALSPPSVSSYNAMKKLPIFAALAVVQLALFVSVAGVVSGVREKFSYYEGNYGTSGLVHGRPDGSGSSWNYTNLKDWPKLCLTGKRQSPISFTNLNPDDVVTNATLQRLQFSSKCVFPREETQMRIVNEGIVSTVSFEKMGRLPEKMNECTLIDPLNQSRIYYFTGLHFHAMPMHQLRTLRPDVEMQLFFATDDPQKTKRAELAVAVMLKASTSINSTSSGTLQHILVDGSLPRRNAMTTCFLTENLSLLSLIPARESYLLYDGSRTYPPCTENVRWVVMTSPILISHVALANLRDAMDALLPNDFYRLSNARPPQALNGRLIFRFDDNFIPSGENRWKGGVEDAWRRKNVSLANDFLGMREGRVLEGSLTGIDGHNKDDTADAVSSLSSSSVSASAKDITRASSLPTTTSPGRYSSSSDQAMTQRNKKPPVPMLVSSAHATGEGTHSYVDESDGDNSSVTTSARSTPETSVASSASASSANESTPMEAPPFSESSLQTPSNESAPHSTISKSTTPTTTTKEPPVTKGKRRHGDDVSKNASDIGADAVDSSTSIMTRAWASVKTFSVGAFQSSVAYAKANPIRAGLAVLWIIAFIFLISTCCRGWRQPVYVVGIDPTELEPLASARRFDLYGGTGTVSVR
ncbi:carbonic anhydrase-like protein [Leishmania tarentolae]|uniref:carbonic anhydrase n=1 Tax=Leishmania tarentolae TaxID=5689 RepID=A0A640KLR0_LEITA|nr:carbonic anhydrase-like protein [Leishmania tarentolae]